MKYLKVLAVLIWTVISIVLVGKSLEMMTEKDSLSNYLGFACIIFILLLSYDTKLGMKLLLFIQTEFKQFINYFKKDKTNEKI